MLILIIEKRVNLIRLLQKLESLYQNTVNKFDIIYYTNLLSQSLYRNPCSVNEYLKGIQPTNMQYNVSILMTFRTNFLA